MSGANTENTSRTLAFNCYVPELDMVVHSEFRPGNVSPRDDQVRERMKHPKHPMEKQR